MPLILDKSLNLSAISLNLSFSNIFKAPELKYAKYAKSYYGIFFSLRMEILTYLLPLSHSPWWTLVPLMKHLLRIIQTPLD